MDPLTALGLAGNVVQFVDFALDLISTGAEIADSARGATERTLELEKVYNTLKTFTSKLGPKGSDLTLAADISEGNEPLSGLAGGGKAIKAHATALEEIAVDCKTLCDQLLNMVKGLRVKEGTSNPRIRSLGIALKTAFAGKKVNELEERLKRFQALIALHFFPLLKEQQSYMLRVLSGLQDQSLRLRLEQTAKFDELSEQLKDVLKRIRSIPYEVITGQDGELFGLKKGTTARRRTNMEDKMNKTLYPKDLRSLEGILSDLTLTEKNLAVAAREQALLESLNFESRPYRHQNIPTAHESTFEWIFPTQESYMAQDGQQSPEARFSFTTWLKSGNGTFWVFGKAGAGKSTLMKFIASHDETRKALEEWAGSKEVVMAAHYFWSTGTAMQKSLNGLLQELLYDILRSCPGLAPDIFPDRWLKTKPTGSLSDRQWSISELYEGIRSLAQHPAMPIRCCLFIDGLDEYDGEHFELCQLLKELSSSANLKCCVSSRPWNVFEDAFAGDPSTMLCIHDLTFQDIRNYTESRLREHPRWKDTYINDEQSVSFIASIAERAQGVFLWVFLVTRSLRDGLVNGDTIYDLQRRLNALPTDLEPFFKHMLDIVDPFYHRYMARTLQMTINAKEPLHLMTYHASEYEEQDDNYALERPLELDLTLTSLPPGLLKPCYRRINARCGGLLVFKKNRVEFLHRTVRDFLLTGPMQDYLEQKTDPVYKVNLSTLKALAFQFRCLLPAASSLENINIMKALWNECLRYANEALEEDEEAGMMILDTVPDVHQDYAFTNVCSLRNTIDEAYQDHVVTANRSLRNTVQGVHQENTIANTTTSYNSIGPRLWHTFFAAGVDRYVLVKLRSGSQHFNDGERSPLLTVIDMYSSWTQGHIDIISRLLDLGSNPNEKDQSGETPWHRFLAKYLSGNWRSQKKCFMGGPRKSVFSIFLRKGAHRTRRISHMDRSLFPFTLFTLDLFKSEEHSPSKEVINTVDDFLAGSKEQNQLQLDELLSCLKDMFSRTHRALGRMKMRRLLVKIISKGNELERDMEFLVAGIEAYFGDWDSPQLVAMIRNNKKQASKLSPACTSAKRARGSQSEQSFQDKKRIKPESSVDCNIIEVGGKKSEVIEIL